MLILEPDKEKRTGFVYIPSYITYHEGQTNIHPESVSGFIKRLVLVVSALSLFLFPCSIFRSGIARPSKSQG